MTFSYDIKVVIWNIKVDYKYFSFQYQVFLNNEAHIPPKSYDDSHSHGHEGIEEFRETLKNGWAVELILHHIKPSTQKRKTI